ncbi:Uncharacterised protein [Corynebacterium renale]|nr:Uncharacterised protein [Corynebacterium renale]
MGALCVRPVRLARFAPKLGFAWRFGRVSGCKVCDERWLHAFRTQSASVFGAARAFWVRCVRNTAKRTKRTQTWVRVAVLKRKWVQDAPPPETALTHVPVHFGDHPIPAHGVEWRGRVALLGVADGFEGCGDAEDKIFALAVDKH